MEPTTTNPTTKILIISGIVVASLLTFGLVWFFWGFFRKFTGGLGAILAYPVAKPLSMTEWGKDKNYTIEATMLADDMIQDNIMQAFQKLQKEGKVK